jgi:hypothetical protein
LAGISNGNAFCRSFVADGGGGGGGECSRIPGARLSDGSVVADRCSPMVTTADSYVFTGWDIPLPTDGDGYSTLSGWVMDTTKGGTKMPAVSVSWVPLTRDMTVPHSNSYVISPNTIDLEEATGALVNLPGGNASCIGQECVDFLETLFSSPGKFCENLTAHGRSDWVLPTAAQLYILYNNRKALGAMSPPKTPKTLGTALFFADSRDDSTKAERVADALISFGSTTPAIPGAAFIFQQDFEELKALLANNKFKKGGQMIFRPKDEYGTKTPYHWYTQNFWWKNLMSTPNPQLSSSSQLQNLGSWATAYFGVRCVSQSDQ